MKKRIWIPLLIVILIAVLWLALPYLIKNHINSVLADIEGYEGSITNVDLNLIRGAYAVDSLVIDMVDGDDRYPFVAVDRINLSLQWSALFRGEIVGEIELLSPDIRLMAETDETAAQFGDDVDWREYLQDLMVIKINRIFIEDGSIHYMDMGTDPVVDLPLNDLELEILNITNVEGSEDAMPTRITMSAISIGGGHLSVRADANFLKPIPDVDLVLEFENVNLPDLNDFFEAYFRVDAEQGEFSLYCEFVVKDGNLEGYLQPVILNLSVLDLEDEDHDVFSAAWELIVEGVIYIFRNHEQDQLATRMPMSGEIDDPEIGVFTTIWNIFRNAFIESFEQAVDGIIDFEGVEEGDEN
ncbi:DUF748 domain-containing protein [soil metagenome]